MDSQCDEVYVALPSGPPETELFPGQGAIEGEGGFDQFLSERVVGVGLGSRADPAVHSALAHHHGRDAGEFQCPRFAVFAETNEHAAGARSAKQVAVEEPRPSAEHGFLRETGHAAKRIVQQFFKALVARHACRLQLLAACGEVSR